MKKPTKSDKPKVRLLNKVFRSYRMRAGYSQTDLADRIKVSPQMVCRWETGRSAVAKHHFEELAKCFKLKPAQLAAVNRKSALVTVTA